MDRLNEASSSIETISGPAWPGVALFTTTRRAGASIGPHGSLNLGTNAGDAPEAVALNRSRLRAILPGEPQWLNQVHGHEVVDADVPLSLPAADACVTSIPGRVLAVLTADCLPVVIVDRHAQVLGVAHAGWRGLASGVLERTVQQLQARHPHAQGWRAWIGPAIGADAFEVGSEVREVFVAQSPLAAALFAPIARRPGKWLADLPGLATLRLRHVGVQEIIGCGLCTFSDPDRFYSYRRDGVTGRMATLAWLVPGLSPD